MSSSVVEVTPSKILSSAVDEVTPSKILSSAVDEVTPVKVLSSSAVEVTSVPLISREDTCASPEVDSVVNAAAAGVVAPIVVASIVPPLISTVLNVEDADEIVPVTAKLPPTLRFSAIPTPPSTINAPVVELVEVVVLFKFTTSATLRSPSIEVLPCKIVVPVTSKLSPTLRFFAIPTPPSITNAPELKLVEFSVLFKSTP